MSPKHTARVIISTLDVLISEKNKSQSFTISAAHHIATSHKSKNYINAQKSEAIS